MDDQARDDNDDVNSAAVSVQQLLASIAGAVPPSNATDHGHTTTTTTTAAAALNAAASGDPESRRLGLLLRIVEEQRRLREEERRATELQLQLELLRRQQQNQQPFTRDVSTTLHSQPQARFLPDQILYPPSASTTSLNYSELGLGLADVASSSIDADLLLLGMGIGMDVDASNLASGGPGSTEMGIVTPERGYHTLSDFGGSGDNIVISDNLFPSDTAGDGLQVQDTTAVSGLDGLIDLSDILDLDALTSNPRVAVDDKSLSDSQTDFISLLAAQSPEHNYGTRQSDSPSLDPDLAGVVPSGHSQKKKATGASSHPTSRPVIKAITPLVLAVNPDDDEEDDEQPEGEESRALSPVAQLGVKLEPQEVFKHAAARASNRRRLAEDPCICSSCHKNIGVVQIRAKLDELEQPRGMDILCMACVRNPNDNLDGKSAVQSSVQRQLSSSSGASKNRKRTRETLTLDCDVCKVPIGIGGIRRLDAAAEDVTPKWMSDIIYICKPCNAAYLFCSECGGGGKTRTGKWRPREMFGTNRKTCSLPHVRIGDAAVQHRVLEVPAELTPSILRGVQDVFFDCLLSLYAIPSILSAPNSRFRSYADVRQEVDLLWRTTVLDAIASPNPAGLEGGKVYLTVAWIEKRHRNKGKKKSAPEPTQVPWLQRLALEGTIAPRFFEAHPKAGASAVNPVLSMASSRASSEVLEGDEEDKVYTAFLVQHFDRSNASLFTVAISPRSLHLPTLSTHTALLRRSIERVQADARKAAVPTTVEHLWCWTRESEHGKLRVVPERLGFVPLERYLRERPSVDRAAFERRGFGPLMEAGVGVHVTSIKDFMKLKEERSSTGGGGSKRR